MYSYVSNMNFVRCPDGHENPDYSRWCHECGEKMQAPGPRRFLTRKEVADLLGCTPSNISHLVANGSLKMAYQEPTGLKRMYFDPDDIEPMRKVQSDPEPRPLIPRSHRAFFKVMYENPVAFLPVFVEHCRKLVLQEYEATARWCPEDIRATASATLGERWILDDPATYHANERLQYLKGTAQSLEHLYLGSVTLHYARATEAFWEMGRPPTREKRFVWLSVLKYSGKATAAQEAEHQMLLSTLLREWAGIPDQSEEDAMAAELMADIDRRFPDESPTNP